MFSDRQREQAREVVDDVVDEQPTLSEQAIDGNRFAGLCLVNLSMRRCTGTVAARGRVPRNEVTGLVQDVLTQLSNGQQPNGASDDDSDPAVLPLRTTEPLGDSPDEHPPQKSINLTKNWQIDVWYQVKPVIEEVLEAEYDVENPANGVVLVEALRGYAGLPPAFLEDEGDLD